MTAARSAARAGRSAASARRFIALLGLAQIVSWGCLYYSFSLFILPMQSELGWSVTAMNGALTTGLLVAAGCSYPIGILIDRVGGRLPMTAGAAGAVVCLLAWSQVTTLIEFYCVWVGLGASMACTLYEPAFIVLTQRYGERARRAITALTLIAGFASTLAMPLIETLLGMLAWREVLVLLAAAMGTVCIPVHWLCLPPRVPGTLPRVSTTADPAALRQLLGSRVFLGLALWFTAYAGTASAVMFQLVPYLKAARVDAATLLLTVALIGPSQVAGRVLLMLLGDRFAVVAAGAVTTTLIPLALLMLTLSAPERASLAVFAVLFGAANGMSTILRGVAPAEWLDRRHYGRVMGATGTPMMIAAALAPLASAALWQSTGSARVMHAAMVALALSGAAGFWLAALAQRRQQASGVSSG